AAALVLLIGAGLLTRSLLKLLAVDLGVRPDHVLGVYLGRLPNGNDLPGRGSSGAYAVLLERLAALPGVASVALTDALPLGGFASSSTVRVDDAPPVADGGRDAALSAVSPEYFNTLGVQVIAGRAFSSADRVDAAPVAIVNTAFARQFLRGGDPVGHQIAVGGARRTIVGERRTIVGEVKDVLQMARDVPATPQVFIPASQAGYWPGSVAIRTKLDPTRLVEPVRRTIQEVDPEQPAARVFTLESELAKSAAPQRDSAVLLGAFAAVALALAAVGLAGVMAFLVAHRTHEIGVRVALGAERGDVLRLVVGEGARLVVLGTVIGVIAAGALTRVLRSLLFGVTATDAVTFLVVPLLLAAVALGAAVVPSPSAICNHRRWPGRDGAADARVGIALSGARCATGARALLHPRRGSPGRAAPRGPRVRTVAPSIRRCAGRPGTHAVRGRRCVHDYRRRTGGVHRRRTHRRRSLLADHDHELRRRSRCAHEPRLFLGAT